MNTSQPTAPALCLVLAVHQQLNCLTQSTPTAPKVFAALGLIACPALWAVQSTRQSQRHSALPASTTALPQPVPPAHTPSATRQTKLPLGVRMSCLLAAVKISTGP